MEGTHGPIRDRGRARGRRAAAPWRGGRARVRGPRVRAAAGARATPRSTTAPTPAPCSACGAAPPPASAAPGPPQKNKKPNAVNRQPLDRRGFPNRTQIASTFLRSIVHISFGWSLTLKLVSNHVRPFRF